MQIVAIPEKYRGQQNTVSLSAMFVRNVIIQMRDQSTDQSEIRDFYHKCQGHLERPKGKKNCRKEISLH